MITDEDIKKIIDAQKEIFPTKTDFENFKDEMKKRLQRYADCR